MEKGKKNLVKLTIIFENCEYVDLKPKQDFNFISIEGIKNNLHMVGTEIKSVTTCEDFFLPLTSKALNKATSLSRLINKNRADKTKKYNFGERLENNSNDIVSVILKYSDENGKETEEEIYVDWNEESDYHNKYQRILEDSNKDKIIVISRNEAIVNDIISNIS